MHIQPCKAKSLCHIPLNPVLPHLPPTPSSLWRYHKRLLHGGGLGLVQEYKGNMLLYQLQYTQSLSRLVDSEAGILRDVSI